MPVFNAADTLMFALASLQAQTYVDWECIVVDDGSTDNPLCIINAIDDSRIQYHRLDKNYGRGYARQHAVELARGKYLTFLDADDWIYPTKFDDQVRFLESEPEIAIVSTGMAISNTADQLMGVRSLVSNEPGLYAPMKYPSMPPLAFAPSMMLTDIAKKTGFDSRFPTAEDADFLLNVLLNNRFAVLPQCFYVYREQGSTTLKKVSSALNYCSKMFQKKVSKYPLQCFIKIVETRVKQICYHLAAALGLWNYVISRRSRTATEGDYKNYRQAFQRVSNIADSYVFVPSGSAPAVKLDARDQTEV